MRADEAIHVIDIALLPEHRGAGIGTKLLKELQEEAKARRQEAEHPRRALQSRAAAL